MAKFDLVVAAKTVGTASIKRLGNSMQGVAGRVKNLTLSMSGLNKAFASLGIVIGGGATLGLLKSAIDTGDSFGKLSTQTGIAANTLLAYTNAAKLAGIGQETVDKGLRRLAQSMREADQGVATYKDAFDDLGISVRDSEGNLKSSEALLGELSDRFADLPDGATKAAIAMEIFGRSGASLIPFLNMGSKGIKEFNYQLSDEFAQNAEAFNDTLTRIGFGAKEANFQFADALLPTLNDLALQLEGFLKNKPALDELFKGLEVGLKIVVSSAFATFAAVRFLTRSLKDLAEIVGLISMGQFGEAFKIMQKGFADTYKQAIEDTKVLAGIINAGQESITEGNNKTTKSAKETEEQLTLTFGSIMRDRLKTFKDSIKSVQEAMADVVVKGIKGMEDALVNFVMTGKLNFRNLANSIIADMARIAIQQAFTIPFTNFIGGFFKNANGNAFVDGKIQKYAYGGVVKKPTIFPMANGIGLMGEAGAEAILPLSRGANGKLGVQATGGGTTNVVVNVNASGGTSIQGDDDKASQFGEAIAAAVQAEIVNQQMAGGLLA